MGSFDFESSYVLECFSLLYISFLHPTPPPPPHSTPPHPSSDESSEYHHIISFPSCVRHFYLYIPSDVWHWQTSLISQFVLLSISREACICFYCNWFLLRESEVNKGMIKFVHSLQSACYVTWLMIWSDIWKGNSRENGAIFILSFLIREVVVGYFPNNVSTVHWFLCFRTVVILV